MAMLKVVKKDGTLEVFDFEKIVVAVAKSAARVGIDLTDEKIFELHKEVAKFILPETKTFTVDRIHSIVEMATHRVDPQIGASYSGFRNWKKEMADMMETIVADVNSSMNKRDRSNSNLNSLLFSAMRTNVSKILLKEMYMKYFLTEEERQAVKDGFIYVHDMDNRLIGTHNCCVVKLENIMDGGFWINGYFCKEPKHITNAVGVVGDIIVTAASAQYGGYTACEIDTTLAKYCAKTAHSWYMELKKLGIADSVAKKTAIDLTKKELKDALQGLEFQLNTRESSRGDYPFVTITFGKDTDLWAKEVAKTILEIRREGHGDKVKQKVVFPKLVMIIREDDANDDVFDDAIATSMVALYPDYIDDKVASPMGCRSFLSDYELPNGENLLHSRGNIGVTTLNPPLIFQNAKVNGLNYESEIIKYVDMCISIQDRTYDYIGKQKAGSNPLMFCEGGFYGGNLNPDDEIGPIVKEFFTASIGITALHELTVLVSGFSLLELKEVANHFIDTVQNRIDFHKERTGYGYSIYGTPAESLCGTQVQQFRKMFGIIPGVSDRDYFSNSFHCHVSEEIHAFEKQDNEVDLFHKHSGGHIQYIRIDNPDNLEAVKMLVKRGVKELGLYQGTNLNACTCNACGHTGNDFDGKCPVCNAIDYNEFNRICGYLGFSRKNGDWTLNQAKLSEVADRKSM
ncbi:MAG: anaerobic ribonucleoside-triphosphate reductase [Cetobacterium sp.]|uniref:anaerobic ribonucleoside-triphosphate reductase n=1 Tax=Cetobacterium sp. TaxID=2071632 RepID=UPI003F2EE412